MYVIYGRCVSLIASYVIRVVCFVVALLGGVNVLFYVVCLVYVTCVVVCLQATQ